MLNFSAFEAFSRLLAGKMFTKQISDDIVVVTIFGNRNGS